MYKKVCLRNFHRNSYKKAYRNSYGAPSLLALEGSKWVYTEWVLFLGGICLYFLHILAVCLYIAL